MAPQTYPFDGFSKLNKDQRLNFLSQQNILQPNDITLLKQASSETLQDLADLFVENSIGCFPMPLGVAPHFQIDGQDYLIPMVVEESSVIAAASGCAKWLRQHQATLTTQSLGSTIIGQIYLRQVSNWDRFQAYIQDHQQDLITICNEQFPHLVERGGGVTDLILRRLRPQKTNVPVALHVHLNPCDAMGANKVTQVCECLKNPIESLTGEHVDMCIVSNLSDTRCIQAYLVIDQVETQTAQGIVHASEFAELDPYRAATHNKGVMNGIDAVLLATGNDWRAVEAGIHAYAARNGHYQPITHWSIGKDNQQLIGQFQAPILLGCVGGVTALHPLAKLSLRLLGVEHAEHLARITAAVGLVQNLAALKALSGPGILQGHMKLHAHNLALQKHKNHE